MNKGIVEVTFISVVLSFISTEVATEELCSLLVIPFKLLTLQTFVLAVHQKTKSNLVMIVLS